MYIGKPPASGLFKKLDSITVVNAQATYNLQYNSSAFKPATAEQLLVSVNGVIQAAGDAYTVSGSQITFSENLVTGDVIDFIIALGEVGNSVVPNDGSVDINKMSSSLMTESGGSTTFKVDNISNSSGTSALEIDSGGRVVQSNRPMFFANAKNTANSSAAWSTGGNLGNNFSPIPFDSEVIDRTNNFDPSTFKFTVPVDGVYLLWFFGISGGTNNWIRVNMVLNRSTNYYSLGGAQTDYGGGALTDFSGCSMQVVSELQAGDKVWCSLDTSGGGTESMFMGTSTQSGMTAPASGMSNGWNGFGGYLI